MNINEFWSLLESRGYKPAWHGTQMVALCPAHDDKKPSLSVSMGTDRKLLVYCHAGCTPETICFALGIKMADLFPDQSRHNGAPTPDEATRSAARIHANAKPIEQHGYLTRKGVDAHGDLREKDGHLIVPLRDETGKIRALQWINPAGDKRFSRGSKVRGLYFVLSDRPDGPLLIAEGFATAASLLEATGAASWMALNCRNLMKVAQIARKEFPDREIVLCADDDGRKGVDLATQAARAIGAKLAIPRFADNEIEGKDFNDLAASDGLPVVKAQIEAALAAPALAHVPVPIDDMQRALVDSRPKIRLPGHDRLLSDFARDLGQAIGNKDIFVRGDQVVILVNGDLKAVTPQAFRCWAEQYFIGYRAKTAGENSFEFKVTMSESDARGTLESPQFRETLRCVRRVNHTRLPIIGEKGRLQLLPLGYHAQTETLTLWDVDYNWDVPLEAARQTIDDLLTEFRFADSDRSKAVAIAAMISLYAGQLLPEKSLRPCFIFVANAEGAGKTLLAQICVLPTLGVMPVASKAGDDDEIRKALITTVREGQQVIFFDNIKGRLSSEPLEAFLSAPVYGGRKLGTNENLSGDNLATVFCTGNGMTVSPDMRRRSLFVELHLEAELAEDRKFSRILDIPALLAMRPSLLAASWALVKHWDATGRPEPSRGHSAFPAWASIIGGIVESAGFGCPLLTADVMATADPDSDDMRLLAKEMAAKSAPFSFAELVALGQQRGLFESIIGGPSAELSRREKSAFGRFLTRYDRRLVANWRFFVEGKGHGRCYVVNDNYPSLQ